MQDSSTDCFPCRLEWRPSRVGAMCAAALVMLAGLSLLLTRWAEAVTPAGQGALAVATLALAVLVHRRESRRAAGLLELLPDGRACWRPAAAPAIEAPARLHEQWPLTTVRLLPAGPIVVFWPDTLCASDRRALRRWAGAAPDASPLSQFWMG